MARDWQEMAKRYRPDEEFTSAWQFYYHLARKIIDKALVVDVHPAEEGSGIISMEVADMLSEQAMFGAMEAAKDHMAHALGATAYLRDYEAYGGHGGLHDLIEEAKVQ